MENKFRKVSILKGLAIIAVVLGHVGFPYSNVIYMYHMALFFFISGYLYNENNEKNMFRYIVKKIKSLYIPFILFEILFVSLRNILIDLHIYDNFDLSKITSFGDWIPVLKQIVTFNFTGDSMLGAIWFLRALFYVTILYAIFNIIYKRLDPKENYYLKTFVIITLAVVSHDLLGKGYNPSILLNPNQYKIPKLFIDILDARNFLFMSVYYLGTLYRKYEKNIPMNIYLAIICFFGIYYSSRIGAIDVASYTFTSPIFFITSALFGIYLNLYIAHTIYNSIFKFKLIENAGVFSIYIMMYHFVSIKLLDVAIVHMTNMPLETIAKFPFSFNIEYMWIIYTIIGTVVPIVIAIIWNYTKKTFKNFFNKIRNDELNKENLNVA
ncbi:acyltransferase family protein [Clostridium perfringens]|nr:acyltransferase family protein [Clostridium perfringens]MDK0711047.1 acyltransferase family protein [Clostridium perfringens]